MQIFVVYSCVEGVFEGALWTDVKDCLTFIGRAQLHGVEGHFWVATLGALFLDQGSLGRGRLGLWLRNAYFTFAFGDERVSFKYLGRLLLSTD